MRLSRYIALFILFSGIANLCSAQKAKVILMRHADRLEYDTAINHAQRLNGNVEFQHENVVMYCDSAWFFPQRNYLNAFGHVHIKQGDSLNMYGDSLRYNGNTRLAKLRGNIRLIERDLRLVTDSIDFNVKKGIGYYQGGAEITSLKNKNTLTSKTGYYHTRSKNIYFKNDVVLKHPDYTLYSDTLQYHIPTETAHFHGPSTIITKDQDIYTEAGWYNTKKQYSMLTKQARVTSKNLTVRADTLEYDNVKEIGKAFGHISFVDTTQDVELRGERAWYNEKERKIEVTKKPLMLRFFEKDTLYLGADRMYSHEPDSGKAIVKAYHNVKFYKSDLEGICDSMVYNEPDSTLRFYTQPVMWYGSSQLTADHIYLIMHGKTIDKAFLQQNSFIISEADTVGHNQVKGRNMIAHFRDNKIAKVRIYGNGQSVYYMGEEGKPYMGMNRTDCSDIELRMTDGKISGIVFITEPDAIIYPMNGINPKDKELKNFNWRAKDRPGRFYLPKTETELEGNLDK